MPFSLTKKYFDKPDDPPAPPAGGAPNPPADPPPSDPPADPPPSDPPKDPPPAETPPAQTKDWRDDRIAKLTKQLNDLRRNPPVAPPAADPPSRTPGETEAEFQRRVTEAASALAAQADWDRQCNAVADQGRKEFKDFDARIKAVMETVNWEDPAEVAPYNDVIAAAIETGQAHKVIYALGADPGEYQKLAKMSPVKRAMEIAKLAATLTNDRAPSDAPKPLTPIGGGGTHYDGIAPDDPKQGTKLPMREWIKQREAQARERGIQ